jgi:hypothetical protein
MKGRGGRGYRECPSAPIGGQQAWRLHVYSLGVLRTHVSVAAPQALRDWFSEEATGYNVTCHDEGGASVTRAQLRVVARQAYKA